MQNSLTQKGHHVYHAQERNQVEVNLSDETPLHDWVDSVLRRGQLIMVSIVRDNFRYMTDFFIRCWRKGCHGHELGTTCHQEACVNAARDMGRRPTCRGYKYVLVLNPRASVN